MSAFGSNGSEVSLEWHSGMHGRKPAVVDYSLHGEGRAVAKLSALKDISLSDEGGGEDEWERGFVGEQVLAMCVSTQDPIA